MSSLDQSETYQINEWFLDKLRQEQGVYLIDIHFTYPTSGLGFVKLLPEKCARYIDWLALVDADVEEICSRRIKRGRKKDSVVREFIKTELDEEKREAIRICSEFGKPLRFLYNYDSELENAVYGAVRFLRNYERVSFFRETL